MKHQNHLFTIEDDKLRGLCSRLPLKKTDQKIAYALAVLCSRSGAYAPSHGVGQTEIARLAGVGVRTVQRHIKYLTRYGILSIHRANGRANVYQIDLVMLFDAPRPSHDIYKRIKAAPEPAASVEPQPPAVPEPLPLFDQEETPAAPDLVTPGEASGLPILKRIARAAGGLISRFTKRTYTTAEAKPAPAAPETAATAAETAATSEPTPAEPPPVSPKRPQNRRQSIGDRNKTTATLSDGDQKPAPLSAEPPPNRRQTAAKSALHIHTTFHNNDTKIKNSIIHKHGDGDLKIDSDFDQVGAPDPESTPPPGIRKVVWGRDVRPADLKDPLTLQELYLVAVEQGFFLDLDTARLNFFALAHYCSRATKVTNKVGLFSSNVDRTVRDKFNQPFESKLSQADEDWARKAIKHIDFPPLVSNTERSLQP